MDNQETKDLKQTAFSDVPGGEKKQVVVNPVPVPKAEVGMDTEGKFLDNILNAGTSGSLDLTVINNFSTVSQSREELYKLLDMMSQDSTVSAILETYAEDSVEYNDQGKIV